jgi:hypothetical protein
MIRRDAKSAALAMLRWDETGAFKGLKTSIYTSFVSLVTRKAPPGNVNKKVRIGGLNRFLLSPDRSHRHFDSHR